MGGGTSAATGTSHARLGAGSDHVHVPAPVGLRHAQEVGAPLLLVASAAGGRRARAGGWREGGQGGRGGGGRAPLAAVAVGVVAAVLERVGLHRPRREVLLMLMLPLLLRVRPEAAARPPGPADAGLSKTSRVWEGVAA